MASVTWETSTISTVISTGMNSLANEGNAISSEINNASGLFLFDDVQLSLGVFGVTPSAGAVVELYIVSALDGTTYEDGDASIDPPVSNLVGVFNIRASTAAQIHTLRQIPIPPTKYKYVVINKTGQTFNASGNTLKATPYRYQSDLTDGFLSSSNFVVALPGDDLNAKYTTAKGLTPNGSALSSTNRSTLLIMPGKYTLSATLTIDTNYVDVIGLGSVKLAQGCTPAVLLESYSVNVTADYARIKGIGVGTQTFTITTNKPNLVFEDCAGGTNSFNGNNAIASSTYINCTGGASSFGGGTTGTASGIFTNCSGESSSFGGTGAASGVFTNCIAGATSFGGSTSANTNGKLINCIINSGTFGGIKKTTFTITIASPAVFSLTSHGFTAGTAVRFFTTGALPTGLNVGQTYFVISTGLSANNFRVSATSSGSAINTSGSQSGTHSVSTGRLINCIDEYNDVYDL